MVSVEFDDARQTGQIVLQPNHSWTWRANVYFLISLAILSSAIAVSFLLQGFWMILPFAGLEMLGLTWAIYYCVRKTHRQEVLNFTLEELIVQSGVNKVEEQHRFRRYFTRFHVQPPKGIRRTQRIAIAEQGRTLEIGVFLSDEEKLRLITELRRMIRRFDL